MRELTFEQTVIEIQRAKRDVLFLIAPNYETRSLSWQEGLDLLLASTTQRIYVHIGMVILQSEMHQNVVLDQRKWYHVEKARDYLEQYKRRDLWLEQETIRYPYSFSVGGLEGILRRWIEPLGHPFTVCLDISGLPRRVILGFMNVFQRLAMGGYVARLFIIYAWATRYPWEKRPAHVGVLQMSEDNMSLSQFIENASDIRGVLVAGRQGYDGRLLLDSLPLGAQVDTYILMAKDDPLSSLRNIYANFSLLSGISVSANANLQYFFSIPRGHQMLVDNAVQVADEWGRESQQNRECVYLVAPFGPKPMSVSAYIANGIVRRKGIRSGIVLMSSHQYADLYSVGCKHVSCFEVDLGELAVSK